MKLMLCIIGAMVLVLTITMRQEFIETRKQIGAGQVIYVGKNPVFVLTNNEIIYGDENSHRDSTGTWHLKDRKLPDSFIKRIHF